VAVVFGDVLPGVQQVLTSANWGGVVGNFMTGGLNLQVIAESTCYDSITHYRLRHIAVWDLAQIVCRHESLFLSQHWRQLEAYLLYLCNDLLLCVGTVSAD